MRRLIVLVALFAVGCGSSSPTAPTPVTPVVVVPPVTPPVVPVGMITVSGCPDAVPGVDLAFYRQIGCNGFDLPLQSVRRWAFAPKLYIRTIDDAGAPIDQVTLDTVQNAMTEAAPHLTAGKFQIAVDRGSGSREGVSGWITVKWPATVPDFCGRSQVAVDGGWIELNYKVGFCSCGGSSIRARTARHELGHAIGLWHTDSPSDLMSGQSVTGCDAGLSARELQAVAYQYR